MNAIPTPDHLAWTTPSPFSTTKIANGCVDVNWMDGKSHQFHPFWLRDNYACADCLHQGTREQSLDIRQVPLDIAALSVSYDDEGLVTVCFSDRPRKQISSWPALVSYRAKPGTGTTEVDLLDPQRFNRTTIV